MKLFRHKQQSPKAMTWDDITLKQYLAIQKLDSASETAFYDIVEVIFGDDILKLPIDQFKKEMSTKAIQLAFMNEQPEPHLPKKVYEINGHRYLLDMSKISTAQYIDFSNLMKRNNLPDDLPRLISIFLLKEGAVYGEYDLDEEIADIESMPITDALSIAVFFKASLVVFLRNFQYYSERRLRGLKIPKEEKKQMIEAIRRATNSAFSLL